MTASDRMRRLAPILGSAQGYIGLVLIALIGLWSQGSRFADIDNLTNAIGYFAPRGILAVGMTLVIITGGIDLSVGALMAVGSTASAWMLTELNWPVVLIVPASMLLCAMFGFVNGAGTAWLKIQSFVMTLAMMSIARGIVREFSDNVSIGTVVLDPNGNVAPGSQQFQMLGTPGTKLFDVPLIGYFPVLALLVVIVVFQLLLSRTTFGRHLYAVGGNPTAARLSGVNVTGVTIAVFTLSGLLSGLAGPISAAYNASADPQAGLGYELDAIAAVVIGGASLAGGRGSVVGTAVGALILTLLDNVLGLNNFSANWQMIIKGIIVIAAVVIQRPDLLTSTVERLRRRREPDDAAPPPTPPAGPAGTPGPAAPAAADHTPDDTREVTTKEF
ncbi:ABC transporter permease [Luteimicrobium sp. NPDC057192]|uniref:ABC transporter permease n=1 Tax=Luteimicrobium sp. NPDC057192 TaxID=3346042 RepID=UPI00362D78DF